MKKNCSICLEEKDESEFTKYVIKDGTVRSESLCMICRNQKRRQARAAKKVIPFKQNAFQKLPAQIQQSVLDKIAEGRHLKDNKEFFESIGLTMSQIYKWNARRYLTQGVNPL